MITFMETKEKIEKPEKCLDSQLWHACAGSMVRMPPVNSKVFYFPQGHLEHASKNIDCRNSTRIPSYILCKVSEVEFMADPETDEVFARIRLVPIAKNDVDFVNDHEAIGNDSGFESQGKLASFAKTLTQSDTNNGGGFSVPRYCAETIFPRLDYSAYPPVQTIKMKDVQGETWKFRHVYRGTPRRHLLTTGWSYFVNNKKLVAGDSIIFMRGENGDIRVGIRRAKKVVPEMPLVWNNCVSPYGGFSKFPRDGEVKGESVIEAANLAANGQTFDVVYYPRASTPEFCVEASRVKTAMQIPWCSGMRFKMAFETEDSSRISWFMGTISSVQVADPVRWPDSPWRLLMVTWDEPELLQCVNRVCPWLVEFVSNIPAIHFSPFQPPHKKLRLPPHQDFPLHSQLHLPGVSNYSPFGSTPAGMQGARHAHYGLSSSSSSSSSSSDLRIRKLEFQVGNFLPLNRASLPNRASNNGNVSCLLTMGNSEQESEKPVYEEDVPFVLFGRRILTEKQIFQSCAKRDV
ncbi:hypothetical protein BUALT_Bualt11G0111000 [Buddleja alternifolia]|uniref:Auxin response factor n=1 Tax=Buddleja alternifolia TaxID=168488 RepID=A0AAV6X516_9LAMI|nr:hypothetical protein BUALT_Bualt11G0111000 [Buddleja alternifolia]